MRQAIIAFALILLLVSVAAFAWQATYEIPWWSVDGGAETSSGGDFTLSGIIGQPDAGPVMTSGDYAVTSGYWHGSEGPSPINYDHFLPLVIR